MAVPKKRTGKSAQAKRRANWKATSPTTSVCSNCGQPVLAHTVCTACGYYKGKPVSLKDRVEEVVEKAAEKKAKPKKTTAKKSTKSKAAQEQTEEVKPEAVAVESEEAEPKAEEAEETEAKTEEKPKRTRKPKKTEE